MNSRAPKGTYRANIWRIAFYIAALSAVVLACLPNLPDFPQQMSDKAVHFAAFAVLTALAVLAHPNARPGALLIGLGSLGLGIELLQSVPAINRSAEALDFAVNIFAIGLTLALIGLGRALARSTRRQSAD